MPITTTLILYHYHELSPQAQERAAQWLRECFDSTDMEPTIEDAVRMAQCLGITIDQVESKTIGGGVRHDPDIRWSGFSSQGDGASFNGTWRYPEWNIVARITKEAPKDLTLHSIARVMHGMYVKYEKDRDEQKLKVVCKYSSSGVSYAHSGWMDAEVELIDPETSPSGDVEVDVSEEDRKVIRDTLRGFADWIYRQLRIQDEYLNSDEHIKETMEANQYTFEANGRRREP